MKILLISAGTKKHGATERAVHEAESTMKNAGEEYETFFLYPQPIASCSGCDCCKNLGRCIYDDKITALSDTLCNYDGYIFFTPVHYGGSAGNIKSAMSRLFYSKKSELEYKPASAVALSRRGGNLTALEEISRFFSFASMPYVSGNYPGIVHGTTWDEAERDCEGLQTVRSICNNMIWLIKAIKIASAEGIHHPINEEKIKTSYIR